MKTPNRVVSFSDVIAILKSDRFNRRNSSFKEFRRVVFRRAPDIRRDYYESFYEYSNGVDDIDFDFNENITCNRAIERFKYYKNIEYYDLGLKITHTKSARNYDDRRRKFYKNARIARYTDSGLVPKIQLQPDFEFKINKIGHELVPYAYPREVLSKIARNSTFGMNTANHLPGGKYIYDKDNSSLYPSPIFMYDPAVTMQNLNKRRK